MNIINNLDRTFGYYQSHLVYKIFIHVGLIMYENFKRKNSAGETTPTKIWFWYCNKVKWNYRAEVSMLIYTQGLIQPETTMTVHQCTHFSNNPLLVHEHAVIWIAK